MLTYLKEYENWIRAGIVDLTRTGPCSSQFAEDFIRKRARVDVLEQELAQCRTALEFGHAEARDSVVAQVIRILDAYEELVALAEERAGESLNVSRGFLGSRDFWEEANNPPSDFA